MTKGLRNTLNLPEIENLIGDDLRAPQPEAPVEKIEDGLDVAAMMKGMEMAEDAFRYIEGADHSHKMDDLYAENLKHARDLMDFGFNVDQARAARLFEVASGFFKNAMDSANSKREAQLKAMKLMLDHQKLELERQRLAGANPDSPAIDNPAVVVEDRNELLRQLLEERKKET